MKLKPIYIVYAFGLSALLLEPSPGLACSAEIVASKTIDISGDVGGCGKPVEAITSDPNTLCAMTLDGAVHGNAKGELTQKEKGVWVFRSASCQPGISARITCYVLH